MTTTTDWRGRLDEKADDDTPIDETLPRRREARALLVVPAAAVPGDGGAAGHRRGGGKRCAPCVPLLVQRGIDHGIPPIAAGGSGARTAW